MDVDAVAADAKAAKSTKSAGSVAAATDDDDNDGGGKGKDAMAVDGEKATKAAEPAFEVLANPARVTLQQLTHVTFDVDERFVVACRSSSSCYDTCTQRSRFRSYTPIVANADVTIVCPFVVLRDRKPSEPEQFVNAPLVPDSDAPDAADTADGYDQTKRTAVTLTNALMFCPVCVDRCRHEIDIGDDEHDVDEAGDIDERHVEQLDDDDDDVDIDNSVARRRGRGRAAAGAV